MEVAVLGTGTIGSTVAYMLQSSGLDVRVMDANSGLSEGHVIDATHAMAHSAHAVGRGTTGGKIRTVKSGVDSITGVDCVVVTASAQRPPGANRRGGRREWLVDNLAIAKTIGAWLQQATPVPVVVVTNPMDASVFS